MDATARPLDGIRVLDLSRLLPGPVPDHGARRHGRRRGQDRGPARRRLHARRSRRPRAGMSGRFLAVNRGKRSLALDLKAPAGRDAFLQMVERADVVVESFRPGVMDRLGVGWDGARARATRASCCARSAATARTGRTCERAGHDLNYIGLAGVLAMGGAAGGAPAMPGVQIADLAGGALWGATAVLGALVGRERTGRGAHLDISMTEGALALLAAEMGNLDSRRRRADARRARRSTAAWPATASTRPATASYLSVGALEPKFWLALQPRHRPAARTSPSWSAPPERQEQGARRGRRRSSRTRTARRVGRDPRRATTAAASRCSRWTSSLAHPLHRAREVFFTPAAGTAAGRSCRSARRSARRAPTASPRASASTAARCSPSTASTRPRSPRCAEGARALLARTPPRHSRSASGAACSVAEMPPAVQVPRPICRHSAVSSIAH